ncbi:MAG: CDP-glycerol glycerophosphotransferase family protein [Erysipelotrichaceae bacterium]|nr:CDP-glycerol glycerophosphotransferase family protein [Erysipelotrichaceae bacterium]
MIINREKIKTQFPLIAKSVRYVKKRKNELSALKRHISRKNYQKNNCRLNQGKIKVVFICQYIPAWSKNKQLFETLKKDLRFEVMLLCVPNRIHGNMLIDSKDLTNDTYDYFSEHGYKEAVNALIGQNEWFDLKHIHPDYVIVNRGDRPMPLPYTSSEIACYAKICFISYGGGALLKSEEYMFDKTLISNEFCQFATSAESKHIFEDWNSILCKLGLTHSYVCGRSSVENAYKAQFDITPSWDFSENSFRLIYTPRWTLEKAWGGSSFIKYKDTFVSLADENLDIDILIRPHPLMFDNFINTGIMSENEVNEYNLLCESKKNIRIDKEKEYLASFWNSSVLVCDFSSVLIEYFVTGKPIIYLTYDEKIDYTDQMKKVLSSCYIANNENELVVLIHELKNGNDTLKNKRIAVFEEEFSNSLNVSEQMKQILINEYKH